MNKPFLLIFIIVASSFSMKKDKQGFIPPGTIKLNNNLFMDQYYVSNIDYREFEFFISDYLLKLESNSLPQYYSLSEFEYIDNYFVESMKIDSIFRKPLKYKEPYNHLLYYKHPAFDDYPVVNLNQSQAEAYCKWRSDVVNIAIQVQDRFKKYTDKKVEYYLPSFAELELVESQFNTINIESGNNLSVLSSSVFSQKEFKNKVIFVKNSLSDLSNDNRLFGSNWAENEDESDHYSISSFRCMCKTTNP